VSGLKDVLSGLLALVALWQYLQFATGVRVGTRRTIPLLICVAFLILAMLAKASAASMPLAAIALDRWIVRRPWKPILASAGLLAIVAVPFVLIARSAQSASDIAPIPLWQRPFIAADCLTFYLYKLGWPINLCVDYGQTPQAVMHQPWIYLVWLVPLAIALGLFGLRRRVRPLIAAALVFLAGCLPTLGLTTFATQFFSTTADHYLYWAMLGPAMALAWTLTALPATAMLRGGTIAALVGLAILSVHQGAFWHDGTSLFEHTLVVNDRSALACAQLASISLDAGNAIDAQEWAARAIERNPDWALPYATFGLAALRRVPPDLKLAQDAYRAALKRDPTLVPALTNLAGLLAQQLQFPEAEQLCRQAIAIQPADVSAHINLGNILVAQGRLSEAEPEYSTAVALAPMNRQAQTNWAALLLRSGRTAQAEQHLRAALQIDPQYAPARRLLDQLDRPTAANGPR
jgi:tetratricopeptide (TPR) repeat protein